jgi:hypothetical protein
MALVFEVIQGGVEPPQSKVLRTPMFRSADGIATADKDQGKN